jgi:hypothetical protein
VRRHLAHDSWRIRLRRERNEHFLDRAPGLEGCPCEESGRVFPAEVRNDPSGSGEMKATVRQHHEQQGMVTRGASDRNPKVGFLLGQVQDIGTVSEHGRRRLS